MKGGDPVKEQRVYSDGRCTLGRQDDGCYLIADGRQYVLTCHPYEPCLYVTDESGGMTAVHNAFDPDSVLCAFARGETVTSITGREYDALDSYRMANVIGRTLADAMGLSRPDGYDRTVFPS